MPQTGEALSRPEEWHQRAGTAGGGPATQAHKHSTTARRHGRVLGRRQGDILGCTRMRTGLLTGKGFHCTQRQGAAGTPGCGPHRVPVIEVEAAPVRGAPGKPHSSRVEAEARLEVLHTRSPESPGPDHRAGGQHSAIVPISALSGACPGPTCCTNSRVEKKGRTPGGRRASAG